MSALRRQTRAMCVKSVLCQAYKTASGSEKLSWPLSLRLDETRQVCHGSDDVRATHCFAKPADVRASAAKSTSSS